MAEESTSALENMRHSFEKSEGAPAAAHEVVPSSAPATKEPERPVPSASGTGVGAGIVYAAIFGAFATLAVQSVGQLFSNPLWRAAFAIVGIAGAATMLFLRKWLLDRFKAPPGWLILAAVAMLFAVVLFGPFVQEGKWPRIPFVSQGILASSRPNGVTGDTPTFLKLQFDADGKATEISKQNLQWTPINSEEVTFPAAQWGIGGVLVGASCSDGKGPYVTKPAMGSIPLDNGFCIQKTKIWIVILTFDKPISFHRIQLEPNGAPLPDWDNTKTTDTFAILTIHGELRNMVLDVTMVK